MTSFKYITYFDSFDGYHPRILNPHDVNRPEFNSMEEIVNYLLSHKDTVDLIQRNPKGGKMFDRDVRR